MLSVPDKCQVTAVGGFLKNKCETWSGVEYYKCWTSNVTYTVPMNNCSFNDYQSFSQICVNDPKYYQLCGFNCNNDLEDEYGFCGNYICDKGENGTEAHKWYNVRYRCNGFSECPVNKADELNCNYKQTFECYNDTEIIKLPQNRVCDGFNDCRYGDDEVNCNHTFGVECMGRSPWMSESRLIWQRPHLMCNNSSKNQCDNNEEDLNCPDSKNSVDYERWCMTRDNNIKYLNKNQLCSPAIISNRPLLCGDRRDQLNCSNSVMECQVENATTQLRSNNVCDGPVTCDNGIDEDCLTVEQNCFVHKHKLCDSVSDCERNSDEDHEVCLHLVEEKCERVLGWNETKIPLDWLCDGVVDCKDGKDEDKSQWKICGKDDRQRCIPKSQECEELFVCPEDKSKYVSSAKLCDNVNTCSGENNVCHTAQDIVEPMTTVPNLYGARRISYCLPGINSLDLKCNSVVFEKLENVTSTIIKPFSILHPVERSNCRFMFGETYVYTSCSNNCIEKEAACPLTILNSSSCTTMKKKIMVPSLTYQLTVVEKNKDSYSNELFSCRNGNCLSYDKVCNLADDCGDGSDEDICINHFKCNSSNRKYLRVESQCDGKIDCSDLSDECNELCGARIINDLSLRVFAWTVGILACVINGIVLTVNCKQLFGAETEIRLFNSMLVFLIGVGDFLIGAYLLIIAVMDHISLKTYCSERLEWLVSGTCSVLGIISTIGSQVSLFAMTCLSLYRANSLRNILSPGSLTKKRMVTTALIGITIFAASTGLAVAPKLSIFEDYFINGLYYPQSALFIGAANKQKHLLTIEKYNGRFSHHEDISWVTIRAFVKDMFTQDIRPVLGISLGFYGNDGVCLFKYFVNEDDPQHIFSLAVLIVNFTCFILITGSYIFINFVARDSGTACSNNSQQQRQIVMQRKITVIILTDFLCWVPFILVSLLHFSGLMDATKYYGFFSIVALPINSVLNPLLYDGSLVDIIRSGQAHFKRIVVSLFCSQGPQTSEMVISNTMVETNKL